MNKTELPKTLKPYAAHLGLEWETGEENAISDCPFCGREEKFSVKVENGTSRCLARPACDTGFEGKKGGFNTISFLRAHWKASFDKLDLLDLEPLAKERNIVKAASLKAFGVVLSITTGKFLVPGFQGDRPFNAGKIRQMYRWLKIKGRRKLLPTPNGSNKENEKLGHGIFGTITKPSTHPDTEIYLCEGPWDAIALYEVLKAGKFPAIVYAVPGCNIFEERWLPLFSGLPVNILYDSDHPKTSPNGRTSEPVGLACVKKVANLLAGSEDPPTEIRYLKWGEEGYDPNLPSGYDVRDYLTEKRRSAPLDDRLPRLLTLLDRLSDVPEEWIREARRRPKKAGGKGVELLKCESFAELQKAWKRAMRWSSGLDCALSVMLASVISTMVLGDQLWVKIIGPASCGKSTLCEAVSMATEFVVAKSTIRGFHTGYMDPDGGKDLSLVSKVDGRTLVVKDGDTLLQAPNLGQILSEARDVYDGYSRTSYRNKASRDYEGIRMTWILCGTSSLRSIDSSELGERFLDCVIMEGIDNDMEDRVLLEVARKSERNAGIGIKAGVKEGQQDEEMTKAMKLTGGYVSYLRHNDEELMSKVQASEEMLRRCARLGKFVAFLRARPSSRQAENAEREFGARLTSQLVRLAKALAAVLNKEEVDDEVIHRVTKVAMDTARGRTLEIIRYLYELEISPSDEGADTLQIEMATKQDTNCKQLLRFLRDIGAVVPRRKKTAKGIHRKERWYLTPLMRKLYGDVVREH